jgi:hypothetical protein
MYQLSLDPVAAVQINIVPQEASACSLDGVTKDHESGRMLTRAWVGVECPPESRVGEALPARGCNRRGLLCPILPNARASDTGKAWLTGGGGSSRAACAGLG